MKENKKIVFSIRFTEKEYQYLKEQAELNHCSLSQYIRTQVLKGVVLK